MSRKGAQLDGLNLVASDMEATLSFYRLLGVEIPAESIWQTATGAHHVDLPMPGGVGLDFDSPALAKAYNQGFEDSAAGRTVIGFRLDSREAVDARYAELTKAGYRGLQEPWDAFWGARYAIVEDPDGRQVGFMSPVDPEKRSAPPDL